ncbi:MAG: BatA domain-containing protein [Planctomycetota bacterium]
MFENLFTASPYVWTGLIAAMIAIPILIHLINLMRHQTVRWAAMDFLLRSHKKHRNWVWLKQLLLLLSRIAALVLALLLLAQIGCNDDRVAKLLGGSTTHHYVLLDDSFSMEDRDLSGRAFDRATATLSMIAARAKNRQNQKFTLLRYSSIQSSGADGTFSDDSGMKQADLNSELVDTQFDQRIETVKGQLTVTQQSVGPNAGLAMIADLIEQRSGENAIVYLLSDFRKRDWESPELVEPLLAQIEAAGAAVELINCVEQANENLAITRLVPTGNVRVAETPLMVEMEVTNYSDRVAENVQVKLETWEYASAEATTRPERLKVDANALPTVFIESIPPGKSMVQSFPVFFRKPGQHTVLAQLPDDAIAADNRRFCSVQIQSAANVLLVDDDAQFDSQLMSLVLNPGGMTGLETTSVTKRFLRDATAEQMDAFDVIFMLDVDSIDEVAVKNLESFTDRGGGVAFFVGPKTNGQFYRSSLYRNGTGLFPVAIEQAFEVPERLDGESADVAPVDHPIFVPALSVKNSLLELVQIKQVWKPSVEWLVDQTDKPENVDDRDDQVLIPEVIATVRGMDGLPLVVEQSFGNGRVIAVLTTAGPSWNNWMRNATFLPIMLLIQDHLAAGRYRSAERLVGEPEMIQVASSKYARQVRRLFRESLEPTQSSEQFDLVLDGNNVQLVSEPNQIVAAGIDEVWLGETEGGVVARRTAFNVDGQEGDLSVLENQKLVGSFSTVRPTLVKWDEFNPEPKTRPASSLSQILLLVLIGTLVGEQCFAYLTNYHRS